MSGSRFNLPTVPVLGSPARVVVQAGASSRQPVISAREIRIERLARRIEKVTAEEQGHKFHGNQWTAHEFVRSGVFTNHGIQARKFFSVVGEHDSKRFHDSVLDVQRKPSAFKKEETEIPVSGLRTEQSHMDEAVIHKYIDKISSGKKIKPPLVVKFKGRHHILDGNHRLAAARALKMKTFVANVVDLDSADEKVQAAIPQHPFHNTLQSHNEARDEAEAIYKKATAKALVVAEAAALEAARLQEAKEKQEARDRAAAAIALLLLLAGIAAYRRIHKALLVASAQLPSPVPAFQAVPPTLASPVANSPTPVVLTSPQFDTAIDDEAEAFAETRAVLLQSFEKRVQENLEEAAGQGILQGETEHQILERIQRAADSLSEEASLVTKTEAQAVYGAAQNALLRRAGFATKLWVTEGDERVRESHTNCEAQGHVDIDGVFQNGLRFPGDPLGGPEEVINCRCWLVGGLRRVEPVRASDPSAAAYDIKTGKWNEELHPRNPEGSPHGGQFTKKPEVVVPMNKLLLEKDMTNVGGSLGGSNPAAQFKDSNGDIWYVKTVKTPTHARNEIAASRLYNMAGVKTPELQMFRGNDGSYRVASKLMPTLGSASLYDTGVKEGFAVDAWLANWDVAGASGDNLLLDSNGHAVRIDVGGSLAFRAQGGIKGELFNALANEINTLRNPAQNAKSAAVFQEMSAQDVKNSISATVAKVTDSQIAAAFASPLNWPSWGLGDAGQDTLQMIVKLKARRDALVALAAGKVINPEPQAPDVKGKVWNEEDLNAKKIDNKLADILPEPKPKIPSGAQVRTMKESSKDAGMEFTSENWEHAAHPRPDRDGVPTNKDSIEFNRLYNLGRGMCNQWKGSAQSYGASQLKRAAIRVFHVQGIVYGNTDTDNEKQIWDNNRVVRMMYRDTQERFYKHGVNEADRFVLYRGVHSAVVTPGAIEGLTTKKSTAHSFNGHDVTKHWVHPAEVLADHRSPFFDGAGCYSETEWLIFSGGFGEPETHKVSDKHSTPSAPSTKIEAYATGKAVQAPIKKPMASDGGSPVKTPKPKAPDATDAQIIKVKELHNSGKKSHQIQAATGLPPSTIYAALYGNVKKYADVGPRVVGMKAFHKITDNQWKEVKILVAQHTKLYHKVDYEAIGKQVGMVSGKVKAIAFAKTKSPTF